jgi:hypothetical protein
MLVCRIRIRSHLAHSSTHTHTCTHAHMHTYILSLSLSLSPFHLSTTPTPNEILASPHFPTQTRTHPLFMLVPHVTGSLSWPGHAIWFDIARHHQLMSTDGSILHLSVLSVRMHVHQRPIVSRASGVCGASVTMTCLHTSSHRTNIYCNVCASVIYLGL